MCAEDRPGAVGKGDTKILTFRKTKKGFPAASLVDCKTSKLKVAVTSGSGKQEVGVSVQGQRSHRMCGMTCEEQPLPEGSW